MVCHKIIGRHQGSRPSICRNYKRFYIWHWFIFDLSTFRPVDIRQSNFDSRRSTFGSRYSVIDNRQSTFCSQHSAVDIRQSTFGSRHSAVDIRSAVDIWQSTFGSRHSAVFIRLVDVWQFDMQTLTLLILIFFDLLKFDLSVFNPYSFDLRIFRSIKIRWFCFLPLLF